MALTIRRSEVEATQPWPSAVDIQGSAPRSSRAFVEVSVPVGPHSAYMHVDGETVAEAESRAFARFERYVACEEHDFERGSYRNGAATCSRCGMWSSAIFEPLERCTECGAATFFRTHDGVWWCRAHADLAPRHPWLDDDFEGPTEAEVSAVLPEVLDGVLRAARAEGAA